MSTPALRTVNLGDLHESPMNPRHYYDPASHAELVASVQEHGILTPLLARPNANGFEIGAGHRRYRAAKDAGLAAVPVYVRDMEDQAFLELLLTENLQRQDISPLDEAEGFRAMTKLFGVDIDHVAKRIGRTRRYIFDRMRLLELIPPAKTLVASGRLPTRHAELLARLTADQQQAAIAVGKKHSWSSEIACPLFESDDRSLLTDADSELLDKQRRSDPYLGLKVKSVAQFEAWIVEHCRFTPDAPVNTELFPETVEQVGEATKVIAITRNHYVQPDAKVEGERTFGPQSWARADGKEKSKPCAFSVLGVIAVGPGYGQAFKVCTNKDTCDVHWGAERRAKAKAAKSPAAKQSLDKKQADTRAREAARAKTEEQERAAFKAAIPFILEAVAGHLNALATKVVLGEFAGSRYGFGKGVEVMGYSEKSLTAEQALRVDLLLALTDDCTPYNRKGFIAAVKKLLGLDVAAIVKASATPATPTRKAKTR
jgi:ParB/RepB/Spo0J family partition protein